MPTQDFKYPPRIYYLSYAIAVSAFLYMWCDRLTVKNKYIRQAIEYLSSNSMWIYLWHILCLNLWWIYAPSTKFFIAFGFVSFGAIALTFVQNEIAKKCKVQAGNSNG